MSRQIEQALLSLMPTYGTDLPQSLVELAESLLAQSRHRASTLKPEEEIARLYACANLACDRLKISLDLPPIEPRPPIPPRIYKRLYSHLNNALSNTSAAGRSTAGRTRTPSKRPRENDGPPDEERPTPSRPTPSKEQSLAQFRTPSKQDTPSRQKSTKKSSADSSHAQLQPWIRPAVKFMCTETSQQRLASSILAGLESILIPGGRKTEDEWVKDNITGLLAAIYFFTAMRVRTIATGEPVDSESYIPQRKMILSLLSRARKEVAVTGLEEGDEWEDWTALKVKDFDAAIAQVNDRDWLEGDWFKGIDDVVQDVHANDVDMLDADGMDSSQIPVRRADTMFQEKYDLLSEARRADYKVWKEAMLSRIADSMAAGAIEMDTR